MPTQANSVKRFVAYFSMEIALENAMPSYSGGLGVLAGDTIRAAADLRLPMVAVSLLYRRGFFSQHLSEDGVVVPIIAIDKHTGRIESQPEIVTRGFLPSENGQELIAGAREVVVRTVEQSNPEEKTDWSVIKEKIRVDLRRYLKKQTSKRPLILPVILEL